MRGEIRDELKDIYIEEKGLNLKRKVKGNILREIQRSR